MKEKLEGEEAQKKYDELLEKGLIIFECIVGSQAYGTAIETSDVDKKFIYIETLETMLSGNLTKQLNVNKDYVGYEIGRFAELLKKGNPNMLDLLATPADCIITQNPLYKKYFVDNVNLFITKEIETSFGEYANSQISKAHGTNKKVMSPMEKERKGLLDFCWVAQGQSSVNIKDYIISLGYPMINAMFGVSALDHMKNCFTLYLDEAYFHGYSQWRILSADDDFVPELPFHAHRKYRGIVDKDDVQLVFSSVAKGKLPVCNFYCNIEGFQKYCKDYREYWDWVYNRNEARFLKNIEVGKGYDTKNMAHCHRLLNMCIEILTDKVINVRRNPDEVIELLAIRNGKMEYDDLVASAKEKIEKIRELAIKSDFPDEAPTETIDNFLLHLRKEAYKLS